MDRVVSVDFDGVPLHRVLDMAPFKDTLFVVGCDLSTPIDLHAEKVTLRRALWRLARKYDLSIEVIYSVTVPVGISIQKP